MRRLTDRFAEAASACADLFELRLLIGDVTLELGFHFYALLHHSSLGGPTGAHIRIDNYPDGWAEELVARGYAADDPVHLASQRTNAGFGWSELPRLISIERRQKKILLRSRHYGLGEGFTIPSNVPGEPSASCSFAVRAGCEMPISRLRCAELIGIHALRAARRLRPSAPLRQRPHLSRREVECLRLVALGKSDWEIAQILGLSTHTARQYVKRARAAYDTISRTQLVVYALRDAWISFDDAIPPSG